MTKRVAVIGAGVAGLAALRRFTDQNESFHVVCFEQLSNVAGLWNYSDNIVDPSHPTGSTYTAIYKYMRTNLPRQVMQFEGCSYPDDLPSYISHKHVREYLEKYADTFGLRKHIKFTKKVMRVDPKPILGKEDVWLLKIMDVNTKIEKEYECDIVIVCCGQYSVPYYPNIKGIDLFQGQLIHAQLYREPEKFKDKNVLVVGGGPSGIDISLEISSYSKQTWLSHRKKDKLSVSKNIVQVGEISYFTSDSAYVYEVFDNDNDEKGSKSYMENCESEDPNGNISITNKIGPIDVIVFCTGYRYSYPFLSADCGIAVLSHLSVGPLYKDLVCISRPTLSIIGLLHKVLPFTICDCQAQFLVSFYKGHISSLSCKDLTENDTEEYNKIKVAHKIDIKMNPFSASEFQWFYVKHLACLGNFNPPPHFVEDLLRKAWKERSNDLVNYKNVEFKLEDDGLYAKVL